MTNNEKKIYLRYGNIPKKPEHLHVHLLSEDRGFAAGKATLRELRFECIEEFGKMEFRATEIFPSGKRNIPYFILLSDTDAVPNRFLPAEEICDEGVGIFMLSHASIAEDTASFKSGIERLFIGKRRGKHAPSKTQMWAFGLRRVTELLFSEGRGDPERVALIAHAEFCPALLIAGSLERKIKYTILNSPSENSRAEHRFARGGKKTDFVEFLPTLIPMFSDREVIIGLSEDDEIYLSGAPTGVTIRRRDGGRYLSREDWHYYINLIKR